MSGHRVAFFAHSLLSVPPFRLQLKLACYKAWSGIVVLPLALARAYIFWLRRPLDLDVSWPSCLIRFGLVLLCCIASRLFSPSSCCCLNMFCWAQSGGCQEGAQVALGRPASTPRASKRGPRMESRTCRKSSTWPGEFLENVRSYAIA